MSKYNRFGKAYTDVTAMYPGSATVDYDAGGANGQVKIEGALDRATLEVAGAVSADVFRAMTRVEAEEIEDYSTADQAAFNLGLFPIVAGSVHLWLYPLLYNNASTTYGQDSYYYQAPQKGLNEVATTSYAVTASTGAITYSGTALTAGQKVYASYDVDMDNASFSCAALGNLVLLGAAAELGEQLYSQSNQEWLLVTQYRTRYNEQMELLRKGELVPDEIRRLTYYQEIERSGGGDVYSVDLGRG